MLNSTNNPPPPSLEIPMIPDLDDDENDPQRRQPLSSPPQNTILSTFQNNLFLIPLLIFFEMLKLFTDVISTVITAPSTLVRRNRENDEILENLKPKSEQLKNDVKKVEKGQDSIRRDIEKLRERIKRIEERRERWKVAAERMERETGGAIDEAERMKREAESALDVAKGDGGFVGAMAEKRG